MISIAVSAALAAGIYLAIAVVVLASRKPDYRHLNHTISELGEIGSPIERLVSVRVFLPVGVLLLISAFVVRSAVPGAAALALAIAIGYLGAAFFPCDAGAPASGTPRNMVHNLSGAIEYIGGGFALFVLSETLGQPFNAAGTAVLFSAFLIGYLPPRLLRGAVQRVSEALLFGSLPIAIIRGANAA